MKIVKIVSLNAEKSQAYDVSGSNYFVAVRFRNDIAEGNYVLVAEKTFTSKTDDDGNIVDCDAWVRTDVRLVGSFKDCVAAKNESIILGKAEELLTAKLAKEAVAEFQLADEELTDSI